MIPLTAIIAGKGTVSFSIKGEYGRGHRPSSFSDVIRPVVFWNITYKCNLKCIHCYINAGLSELIKKELNNNKIINIADQIIEQKIPLVVFTGGEPLASEKFWIAAEHLYRRGYKRLSLSSNGTLLNDKNIEKLKKLEFKYIGISLDSLKPEVHDRFRGVKGSWEKAVAGMKNSVEKGIPTGLRVTITKNNYYEIPLIVDFAYNLGLQRVSIYLLDTIGRASNEKNLLPSHNELKETIDKLIVKAEEYQDYLEILLVRMNFVGIYIASKIAKDKNEFLELLEIIGAQGDCGRKTISIYPDGTVKPCQFLEPITIGDLRRESLKEILDKDNPRLKPFLEVTKRLRGSKCRACPFKNYCGGGSRNRALVLGGDFWGDDPLCFVNLKEIVERWDL